MEKRPDSLIDELKTRLDNDRKELKSLMSQCASPDLFEVYAKLAGEINKNNQLFLELAKAKLKEQVEKDEQDISELDKEEMYKEMS